MSSGVGQLCVGAAIAGVSVQAGRYEISVKPPAKALKPHLECDIMRA
jgi:hypothetical protein